MKAAFAGIIVLIQVQCVLQYEGEYATQEAQ